MEAWHHQIEAIQSPKQMIRVGIHVIYVIFIHIPHTHYSDRSFNKHYVKFLGLLPGVFLCVRHSVKQEIYCV